MFLRLLAVLAMLGMATTANASTWNKFWGGSSSWSSSYSSSNSFRSYSYKRSSKRGLRNRGGKFKHSVFFGAPVLPIQPIEPQPLPTSEVPLPAAGFLLLGGLGGLAVMRRRSKV